MLALAAFPASAGQLPQELPGWMTGGWERIDGEKWADEFWTPPRGGMMMGSSRTGKSERLTFWELMRIVREADGKIAFIAIAGDQKPVRFTAASAKPNEIIFENAAHDFPQRIRYWREGRELRAEISLIDGSKAVPFAFTPMGAPDAKN
jgi:Domain of unknown function (DUF6265)